MSLYFILGVILTKTLVIFDMDGTLLNSKKDISISINYVRQLKGFRPLSEEYIIDIINGNDIHLAKKIYNTDSYEIEDKNKFEEHYIKQCSKNTILYEGISELLEELRFRKISLSVATNAPTKFAVKILEALKVDHYFDFIVGSTDVKFNKPHTEMIDLILDKYNVDVNISKVFMLGDTYKDIEVANNSNIKGIFASWGFGVNNSYDNVINKPQEFLKYI